MIEPTSLEPAALELRRGHALFCKTDRNCEEDLYFKVRSFARKGPPGGLATVHLDAGNQCALPIQI
jgi:hypothetical protein